MTIPRFQSTLPYGERPTLSSAHPIPFPVSIHAPVWGATLPLLRFPPCPYWFQSTLPYGERRYSIVTSNSYIVFQSTLPYGERRPPGFRVTISKKFQSTLPYGERQRPDTGELITKFVSIHAPVWGATRELEKILRDEVSFNPRSRMGSDSSRAAEKGGSVCFNPRSRMGSDGILFSSHRFKKVSIHAPVWGATGKRL